MNTLSLAAPSVILVFVQCDFQPVIGGGMAGSESEVFVCLFVYLLPLPKWFCYTFSYSLSFKKTNKKTIIIIPEFNIRNIAIIHVRMYVNIT